MDNRTAAEIVARIEEALGQAKAALLERHKALESAARLSTENRELKKKNRSLEVELDRERIIFGLFKRGLKICEECDGIGGYETYEGGQDCETCSGAGSVPQ